MKLTPDDAKKALAATLELLGPCFAKDVVERMLRLDIQPYDDDTLFRTLMLDENWSLQAGRAAWEAAHVLVMEVLDAPF